MQFVLPRVDDFEVTGDGCATAWKKAEWQTLRRVWSGSATYGTRAKAVYSATGIYFLFDCEDRKLACTALKDFGDLYLEDVVEVFLWPDERQPLYFEYEISPLGAELPIVVPNCRGVFHGWLPWHYTGPRQARRATEVRGGPKLSGAAVSGWNAEFFLPFALLQGLGNTPPTPGMSWRGNMYRIDYDQTPESHWAWSPVTGKTFHKPDEFGTLVFG